MQAWLKHPVPLSTSFTGAASHKEAGLHDCHCPVLNNIPIRREACKNYTIPFALTFLIYFLYSYMYLSRDLQITSIMEEKELKWLRYQPSLWSSFSLKSEDSYQKHRLWGWGWDSWLMTYGGPWRSLMTPQYSLITQHSKLWVLVVDRHGAGDGASLLASGHVSNFRITHKQHLTGSSHKMWGPFLLHVPFHCPHRTLVHAFTLTKMLGKIRALEPIENSQVIFLNSWMHIMSALTQRSPPEGRKKDKAEKQEDGKAGEDPRLGTRRVLCKYSTVYPSRLEQFAEKKGEGIRSSTPPRATLTGFEVQVTKFYGMDYVVLVDLGQSDGGFIKLRL